MLWILCCFNPTISRVRNSINSSTVTVFDLLISCYLPLQLEDVDSTCQLSLESSSALGGASRRCTDNEVQEAPLETHGSFEPQQDWSGLGQDDDMVVIQDWAESSLANHNIQTAALPEDAAGKEPDQPLCREDASQPPGGMVLIEHRHTSHHSHNAQEYCLLACCGNICRG